MFELISKMRDGTCFYAFVADDGSDIWTLQDLYWAALMEMFTPIERPLRLKYIESRVFGKVEFKTDKWYYRNEPIFIVTNNVDYEDRLYYQGDYGIVRRSLDFTDGEEVVEDFEWYFAIPYKEYYICYALDAGLFLVDRDTYDFRGSLGFEVGEFSIKGKGSVHLSRLLMTSKDFKYLVDVLRKVSQ